MTSQNRSLLQLDVKDLGPGTPTPVAARLGLISLTVGALVAAYFLFSALSASTTPRATARPAPSEPMPVGLPVEVSNLAGGAGSSATIGTPADEAAPGGHAGRRDETMASPEPSGTPAGGSGAESAAPGVAAGEDSIAAAEGAPVYVTPSMPPPSPRAAAQYRWTTVTVRRHDTLSRIFQRHGLSTKDAYALTELPDAAVLGKIRSGQKIHLATDEQGALTALRYPLDVFSELHITRELADRADPGAGAFRAELVTRAPEIRLRRAGATISTSLLEAAKNAGIALDTVYEFARIFGWQVDFSREIRRGDRFSMIFEELYLDGKKIANGDILAAELRNGNQRMQVVRHVDEDGRTAYYAPNGDGIQGSFLRSPLKFGRVTSNFTNKRFHPILKKWRAHRGVDYGAPSGTPVRVTGDGVVAQVGHNHGYGKTITIRHGMRYTTLYAHLRGYAKGMKPGARVKQGDTIGYVGSTGWATGPHLHYEFRVDGVHRNPLTVKLPKSAPVPDKDKAEFLRQAGIWVARLEQADAASVAQLDGATRTTGRQ